MHTIL